VVAADAPLAVRDPVTAVFLHSGLLLDRTRLRFTATEELLRAHDIPTERVEARGQSALANILSTIFYGDWTSFYLAALYDINPTPIGPIDTLKARLAQG